MPPPHDEIGYEALQQEALRGVVRAALKLAAARGSLPGDHHFFITFKTAAPGVTLPKELLAQYPDEMSIILQKEYFDLAPGETFFSVTLRFGGQPKSLSIPYSAITFFRDPGVEYMLRFTVPDAAPQIAPPAPALVAPAAEEAGDKAADGPNIVSLDQFRKK